jgi:hypothetical protein
MHIFHTNTSQLKELDADFLTQRSKFNPSTIHVELIHDGQTGDEVKVVSQYFGFHLR